MKKMLIVASAFWPIEAPRSYRTTELALELVRRGYNITLLLPDVSEERKAFLVEHRLKVITYGSLSFAINPFLKLKVVGKVSQRLLYQFLDFPSIEHYFKLKKYNQTFNQFDVVISIAAPHSIHWGVAAALKKNKKVIWIADCGDPYMGITLESFKKPFYFKYFEKSFCQLADFITVPVPEASEGYYPEFHNKISVIPQGFDFSQIQKGSYQKTKDYPVFAYAGSVATKGVRSLLPVFDSLKRFNQPFEFHLYSKFAETYYKSHLEKLGIADKIVFHGHLKRSSLLTELCKYDFLINLDNGTSMQSPSKLIDYAFTERPILNLDPKNYQDSVLFEFFKQDYQNQYGKVDWKDHEISIIASKFENLFNR